MALNTFKCNYLIPLHFKGLTDSLYNWSLVINIKLYRTELKCYVYIIQRDIKRALSSAIGARHITDVTSCHN